MMTDPETRMSMNFSGKMETVGFDNRQIEFEEENSKM
jgi:hypothetical protein